MVDDLNTSAAMASLFENVKKINILAREKKLDAEDAAKILNSFHSIDTLLGLLKFDNNADNATIQQPIKTRNSARLSQNWEHAPTVSATN